MLSILRRRLSYANVTATLALFLALGGTAYSAAGGNFILGQINTAGTQPTRLSANTDASTLRLTNTGTGLGNIVVAGQSSGILGQSTGGNGVEGKTASPSGAGLYGQNTGGGWAVNAAGNATQSRASNGFVKAMAYVFPRGDGTSDILECFNSQLPPSQATSGDCGISTRPISSPHQSGDHFVDFGFDVSGRFPLIVTTGGSSPALTATAWAEPSSTHVWTYVTDVTNVRRDASFYIFLF